MGKYHKESPKLFFKLMSSWIYTQFSLFSVRILKVKPLLLLHSHYLQTFTLFIPQLISIVCISHRFSFVIVLKGLIFISWQQYTHPLSLYTIPLYFYLLLFLFLSFCILYFVCIDMHVPWWICGYRGQLLGVNSFFPLCKSWGSNSRH